MSNVYQLIQLNNSGLLTLDKQSISFLENINEEIILVTFISSINENDDMNKIKFQLISNIINEQIDDEINNGVSIILKLLSKDNSNAKILLCNIHTSNKNLISLLFFASSLFIFCINNELNENEINKFKEITKLPTTIEMNNKNSREIIFTETSPKLLFYISNCNLNPNENSPKDYLDNFLRSKSEIEVNLIKDSIIKFFPDRDCIFDNQDNSFNLFKNKILKDLHSKNIRGKLFNGKSLLYFLNEYIKILSKNENPNFDNLWNKVIQNDIELFKTEALNSYNRNILNLKDTYEEDELIKFLYNFKLDAMNKLNDIFRINVDTFNNSEYLSWFNNTKREIENYIDEQEEKKINLNLETANYSNKELLVEIYKDIDNKINNNYYNSSNVNEYLKDYETFISGYNNRAIGKDKLKLLIDFVSEKKSDFIKKFVNILEKENKDKLDEVNKKLEESNNLKKNVEEKYKEINDMTEVNSKKIDDLNSDLEKKKREIKNLNEEIDRVENEIRKVQMEDNSNNNNTNNNNSYNNSMRTNDDLNKQKI